jgi:hypothetical protein
MSAFSKIFCVWELVIVLPPHSVWGRKGIRSDENSLHHANVLLLRCIWVSRRLHVLRRSVSLVGSSSHFGLTGRKISEILKYFWKFWGSIFVSFALVSQNRVTSLTNVRLLNDASSNTWFLKNNTLSYNNITYFTSILSRVAWYAWQKWLVLDRMIGFISTLVTRYLNHN